MNKDELKKVLDSHALWLAGEKNGERANFRGADLTEADLTEADLTEADLRWAKMSKKES